MFWHFLVATNLDRVESICLMQGWTRRGSARWIALFCFCTIFPHAFAETEKLSSDLPEDTPIAPEVITNLSHPLSGRTVFEAGFSYLNGDKFLTTRGIGLRGTYFIAESIGFESGIGLYTSSLSNEVSSLSASGVVPLTHDPSFIFRGQIVYQPVFGKIAIGSFIQHFRLGIEGGFHLVNESFTLAQTAQFAPKGEIVIGPNVGVRAVWPVSDRINIMTRGELLFHKDVADSSSSRRVWEFSVGMGYLL